MKTVTLTWTPSASIGVDGQDVRIFDSNSGLVYGEARLEPQAGQFMAEVSEGTTVQGAVATLRGTEEVVDVSVSLNVPYGPLQGVTNLTIGLLEAAPGFTR